MELEQAPKKFRRSSAAILSVSGERKQTLTRLKRNVVCLLLPLKIIAPSYSVWVFEIL